MSSHIYVCNTMSRLTPDTDTILTLQTMVIYSHRKYTLRPARQIGNTFKISSITASLKLLSDPLFLCAKNKVLYQKNLLIGY